MNFLFYIFESFRTLFWFNQNSYFISNSHLICRFTWCIRTNKKGVFLIGWDQGGRRLAWREEGNFLENLNVGPMKGLHLKFKKLATPRLTIVWQNVRIFDVFHFLRFLALYICGREGCNCIFDFYFNVIIEQILWRVLKMFCNTSVSLLWNQFIYSNYYFILFLIFSKYSNYFLFVHLGASRKCDLHQRRPVILHRVYHSKRAFDVGALIGRRFHFDM